jgi:hypothetical protein
MWQRGRDRLPNFVRDQPTVRSFSAPTVQVRRHARNGSRSLAMDEMSAFHTTDNATSTTHPRIGLYNVRCRVRHDIRTREMTYRGEN